MKLLTTKEAAEALGVTTARVRQLIAEKRLPSEKRGRDHFIKEEDLELVRERKVGAPRQANPSPEAEYRREYRARKKR